MKGEVAPGDVIATLRTLLTMLVIECDVEVDGAAVSEQDKRRIVASPARVSPTHASMTADDLSDLAETYRSLADVIRHSFRQLADAEFDSLRKVQGVTAELANEALRQRTLLHNSLKDCDALDRAVVASNHADRFSERIRQAAVPTAPQDGVTFGDVLHGFQSLVKGEGAK